MNIKPIKSDVYHEAALREIEALWGAVDGHTRADLARLIGNSRATEVLRRKRALTLPMIRRISQAWHVPERLLVREYAVG